MRKAFLIVSSQYLPSQDGGGAANFGRSIADGVVKRDRGCGGLLAADEVNTATVSDSARPGPQNVSSE
jgi:hypothetical protein